MAIALRYHGCMATTAAKKPRRRAVPDEEPGTLFVRNVPPPVMAALEEWARELTAERGTNVTRLDVVREVLHRATQDRAKRGGK